MAHDGANRNDQPLLEPTLESIPIERPEPTPQQPQGLCLDRGYDSPPMHDLATKHGYTPHIRSRGEEIKLKAHTPGWVLTGGTIRTGVTAVVKGATVRSASIKSVLAAQDGPPQSTAVALPSSSRVTSNVSPEGRGVLSAMGVVALYHARCP